MVQHEFLVRLIPYTADIFVFTYPVYLVAVYLYGIVQKKRYYKEASLAIFFSAWVAAAINYIIQFFGDKTRPEQAIENKANLILEHLPTDPFPSDHAAVSAAIAMATLCWGLRHNDKLFLRLSLFFWFASLTMCLSRVMVAIHWPTDILVGIMVWVLSACIVLYNPVWRWLQRTVVRWLVWIEESVVKRVFGRR